MKQQRHKREESFSILLISNVGQGNRQFHVSLSLVRLVIAVLLVICVAMACLIGVTVTGSGRAQVLRSQIGDLEQQIEQQQEEIDTLKSENLSLASENESLQQAAVTASEEEGTEASDEGETEPSEGEASAEGTDPAFPGRYPCSGSGIMSATYSEDEPYISIVIRSDGNVVAAGNGTVAKVGSDDTYPLIVEVDHGNGYQTRYLCRREADMKKAEGDSVQTGDTLLTIQSDDTQLDYQVIYEGEIIDPLSVIDAKG